MPVFKGNLHAHTTFSDGRRPIDEVIARYRELDYDFLAITDHEDRIFEDYWFNIPAGALSHASACWASLWPPW